MNQGPQGINTPVPPAAVAQFLRLHRGNPLAARQYAQQHPGLAAAAAAAMPADNTQVRTSTAYWSRVRMTSTVATKTYTITKGTSVSAFGYAIGSDMGVAGRAGVTATEADTNIQTASQTVGNEEVTIYGVAIQATSENDPGLLLAGAPDISVRLIFDGGARSFLLGNVEMLPGANGLYGAGTSAALGASVGALTNGWPEFANSMPFPEGIVWAPAGGVDGNLVVHLSVQRDFSLVSTLTTPPTTTPIDLRVQLITENVSGRSQNR